MENKTEQRTFSCNSAMFRISCGHENGQTSGWVYCPSFLHDEPFENLAELLFKMDDMCEALQYPQAAEKKRYLGKSGPGPHILQTPLRELSEDWPSCVPYRSAWAAKSRKQAGGRSIFLVHLMYRQNASMQGILTAKSRPGTKKGFRSALELISMIDAEARLQAMRPAPR